MYCSKCGAENADGSQFCNKCGAEIGKPASTSNDALKVHIAEAQRGVIGSCFILAVSLILLIILAAAVPRGGGRGNEEVTLAFVVLVGIGAGGTIRAIFYWYKKTSLIKKLK
jgi:hypothetical protein